MRSLLADLSRAVDEELDLDLDLLLDLEDDCDKLEDDLRFTFREVLDLTKTTLFIYILHLVFLTITYYTCLYIKFKVYL